MIATDSRCLGPHEAAADEKQPGTGLSHASLPQPDETVGAQLRRRREASLRMPPLADGRRDPLDPVPWASDDEVLREVWRMLAQRGLLTDVLRRELTGLARRRAS